MKLFVTYYYKKWFSHGVENVLLETVKEDDPNILVPDIEEYLKIIKKAREVKIIAFERFVKDLEGGAE